MLSDLYFHFCSWNCAFWSRKYYNLQSTDGKSEHARCDIIYGYIQMKNIAILFAIMFSIWFRIQFAIIIAVSFSILSAIPSAVLFSITRRLLFINIGPAIGHHH